LRFLRIAESLRPRTSQRKHLELDPAFIHLLKSNPVDIDNPFCLFLPFGRVYSCLELPLKKCDTLTFRLILEVGELNCFLKGDCSKKLVLSDIRWLVITLRRGGALSSHDVIGRTGYVHCWTVDAVIYTE
jgi:hypothetical protein